jgi:hypothetical protein
MLPGSGTALVRAATVVPVILLVLFAGVFGLAGLLCGSKRREYAMDLSQQAMSTAALLIHGPSRQASGDRGQTHPDSASRELDVTIGQDVTAAAPRDVGITPGPAHTGRARRDAGPNSAKTRAAGRRRPGAAPGPR